MFALVRVCVSICVSVCESAHSFHILLHAVRQISAISTAGQMLGARETTLQPDPYTRLACRLLMPRAQQWHPAARAVCAARHAAAQRAAAPLLGISAACAPPFKATCGGRAALVPLSCALCVCVSVCVCTLCACVRSLVTRSWVCTY